MLAPSALLCALFLFSFRPSVPSQHNTDMVVGIAQHQFQKHMQETDLDKIQSLVEKLSEKIRTALSETSYDPPSESISVEALLSQLLHPKRHVQSSVRDLALTCALLASSKSSDHDLLSWVPKTLSSLAESAFRELSEAYSLSSGFNLVVDLMPEVIPLLKDAIKESSIDKSDCTNEISAASARTPVGLAIVAAYQFRWLVTQLDHESLVNLCSLVTPCALTALDHWSPEVKGQGMISLIEIGKNVDVRELGGYGDVILDACCHNMACSDEIWHLVVEMSVLFVTRIHGNNPRSAWYERILNEMLSHLERQPRNRDRRVAWLKHVEPLFSCIGLLVVAHFRRIFPLFLQWLRADDDDTVVLVLKQVYTIIRLTWIRNTPYVGRVADEVSSLSKRRCGEDIHKLTSQIQSLLQGLEF